MHQSFFSKWRRQDVGVLQKVSKSQFYARATTINVDHIQLNPTTHPTFATPMGGNDNQCHHLS